MKILEDWIATTRDGYGAKEEDELYDSPGIERVTAYWLHQVMRDAVRSYRGDVWAHRENRHDPLPAIRRGYDDGGSRFSPIPHRSLRGMERRFRSAEKLYRAIR